MRNNRFLASLSNIYRLGLKELRSLFADKVLLVLLMLLPFGCVDAVCGRGPWRRRAPIGLVRGP